MKELYPRTSARIQNIGRNVRYLKLKCPGYILDIVLLWTLRLDTNIQYVSGALCPSPNVNLTNRRRQMSLFLLSTLHRCVFRCVCGLAKKLYFYVSHKESTVREKIAGCIEEGFIQKARQTVVVSVWGTRSYAALGIFGLNMQYCVHAVVYISLYSC